MAQKSQIKSYIFSGLVVLSIFSFVFVNMSSSDKGAGCHSMPPSVQKEQMLKDEKENRRLVMPDLSLLRKMLQLAKQIVNERM